jgi:hypothetical protein
LINDALVPHLSVQGRPSLPRFASEEVADEEFAPVVEPRPVPAPAAPQAIEEHDGREVFLESAPFDLQPEHGVHKPIPLSILEDPAPDPARTAGPAKVPMIHAGFDEPFEEEYARLIPERNPGANDGMSPGHAFTNRASEGAGQEGLSTRSGENLDIPAFLRRPVS